MRSWGIRSRACKLTQVEPSSPIRFRRILECAWPGQSAILRTCIVEGLREVLRRRELVGVVLGTWQRIIRIRDGADAVVVWGRHDGQ